MNTRHVLGILFFAVAVLLALAQTYFFINIYITKPEFVSEYAVVQGSIENYGFAVLAMIAGIFMFRGCTRLWLWFALLVAGAGSWLFVAREIWLHYFVLPQMRSGFLATHSYFGGPIWWVLVRLSWHILLPTAFVLSVYLLLRRAPNTALEPLPH